MSLFSVFDPVSYFGISFNWLIVLLIFLFVPMNYYILSGGYEKMINSFGLKTGQTFKDVGDDNYLGMSFLCVGTFMYLVLSNLLGLFPFVFSGTAHPMMTLGWGFVLWVSFFSMGWVKNFQMSAAHLVPQGSPMNLAPVMVLIESISHLIRPFTLSIRLAANMMAGHLIVGLLSSISTIGMYGIFSSLMLQSVLLVLEFGVSVIQGFVFSILILLYALEYY